MKNLEIKTIEHNGIKVSVKIDYDKQTISLVERKNGGAYQDKAWYFSGRGVEYMKGWSDILEAMNYAAQYGKEQLKEHLELSQKNLAKAFRKHQDDMIFKNHV